MSRQQSNRAAFLLLAAVVVYSLAGQAQATYLRHVTVAASDSASIDAFGRWRVSSPFTLFESKQTKSNAPLFWDESLETGAGITSAWSGDTASTVFTSTLNTAGKFTRQTYERIVYHPGKSHLVLMTGILARSGGGTGVQRRIGYFDDDNGMFFEDDAGTVKIVTRSSTSGSPADTKVTQASWSNDSFDGSGPSGITIDWAKTQIFYLDFEWLGVGRQRFGLVIDGKFYLAHEDMNANSKTVVYMSTPDLPLRYQMVTTGSSPVSTMEAICAVVASEGGVSDEAGVIRAVSTAGTHVDVTTEDTLYAIVGIRLKSAHLATTVDVISVAVAEFVGSKTYEWVLIHNPTVAGTFTYGNGTDTAVEFATGATANTVTGGHVISTGFGASASKGGSEGAEVRSNLRLGAAIDGTQDTIVLCVRPNGGSSGIDIEGSITFREH